MHENTQKKSIPTRLEWLLVWEPKTTELIKATGRFIEGLLEWDYLYDSEKDQGLQQLEKLVRTYFGSMKVWSPKNVGLLDTKTYKRLPVSSYGGWIELWLDMRNPRIAKKIRLFWIGKSEEKRTEKEKAAFTEWLRNTLLIDREAAERNPDYIEQMSNQHITDAINDIHTTLIAPLEKITGSDGKSGYYKVIYREGITVYWLLCLAKKYFKSYRYVDRKTDPTERDIRTKEDYNKAMYEISRIFAFASMYIDVEHVPWRGVYRGDKIFLVSKLLELTNVKDLPTPSDIIDMVNPFYESTDSVMYYWKKAINGWYECISPEIDEENPDKYIDLGFSEAKFESIDLMGGGENNGEKKKVKILHLDFRHEKDKKSTAHKILRKGLTSPREVLDTRGFRFVVSSKEEANTLLDILIQELTSGPERAWAEAPSWQTNGASWDNFECFKWTLNVIHKRLHTNRVLDKMYELVTDPVKEELTYLFSKKGYILETEIQIFVWTDSYIAAHCDKESPAHVDNYKKEQYLEESILVYPLTIFPKAHARLLKKLTEKQALKAVSDIRQRHLDVMGEDK